MWACFMLECGRAMLARVPIPSSLVRYREIKRQRVREREKEGEREGENHARLMKNT